jgi:hypothetical protein
MRFLTAILLSALASSLGHAAPSQVQSPEDIIVWSVNEYILSPAGVELAARVPSQLLIRGWFKWAKFRDLAKDEPLLRAVHANGQLFGGGVTMSALYRGENGIDEATFLDFATRDPNGQLYPAFGRGNYYHGTLSNPRYVDYCLKWAFQQIDAGVDHLFMDEVDAAQGQREGYDDYAVREFRDWLLALHKDWGPADPRWEKQWRVPLGDRKICPDGSMRGFDYRAYLQHHRLTEQPWGSQNALAGLWSRFKVERDDRVWREVCDRLRAYAAKKGRRVWIAANGLNRYVDHQIQNLWDNQLFLDKEKRLDASRSLMGWGRELVLRSRTLLGRDVPIVVFHDWGFEMPWQNLPVADRNLWLRVYAPELYAGGVFFAFPVHGPFGCDSEKDGTLPEIIREATFFRKHADMVRLGDRVALDPAVVKAASADVAVSFVEQPRAKRRLVHLVNHRFRDHCVEAIGDLEVVVPSPDAPKSVVVVSPDFEGERTVPYEHKAGKVVARVPSLEYYDLLVLTYDRMAEIAAARADRDAAIAPRPFWGASPATRFEIGPTGLVKDAVWVNSYLQGNLHSQLRDTPTFVVDYANDGEFGIVVNSVATLGAVLEIAVDGRTALRETIADKDRRNDASAREIARTFSVPVARGRHQIRVANTGGDWLTVDKYVFRNALAGSN